MPKMPLTPMRCTPCDGGWACVCPCGYSTQTQAGTAYHVCSTSMPAQKPGLGDIVASGLAAVGITKERAQAVASAVGVKDCGCKKRQAKLNELGHRYLGLPPGQSPAG